MQLRPLAVCAALALAASPVGAAPASMNFTAAWTNVFETDLGHGGTVGLSGLTVTGGATWGLSQTSSLGLQARVDVDNWQFDKPAGFGGLTPWQATNRFSLSLPYATRLENGWNVALTPSVESNGEEGASASKTLAYGLTGMVMKGFAPDKVIGLGVAAFRNVEETRFFPFFVVDWKLAENWRLSNPLQVSPSGPAGLMLSYQLSPQWELGAGAAYRSYRFRLASDNPIANEGVGEADYMPVFAQATYRGQGGWRFDLYGGAMTGGRLKVMDRSGDNDIAKDDVKTAPAMAASFSARF